jgi:hypothetical protein
VEAVCALSCVVTETRWRREDGALRRALIRAVETAATTAQCPACADSLVRISAIGGEAVHRSGTGHILASANSLAIRARGSECLSPSLTKGVGDGEGEKLGCGKAV